MSLKYEVNHAAGIPKTLVSGFAPRGIVEHWTASTATGRAAALGVIQHFVNTRLTVNASYSILLWHEHRADLTCVTVAMEIVPLNWASHSIAPSQVFIPKTGSARETARFAEVRRILARDNDPNADTISVSFVGMPSHLATAVACPTFQADIRALMARIKSKVPTIVDRPHFGHGWIQPISRYETDATTGGADLLIGPVLYAAPSAPQEDDMLFWRPVRQDWTASTGTVFYDGAGAKKVFTAPEPVTSVAESSDGRWRLVRYGAGELLVVDARGALKEGPGLVPVPNTRIPATGFGFEPPPVVAGLTEAQVAIRVDDALKPYKNRLTEFRDLSQRPI